MRTPQQNSRRHLAFFTTLLRNAKQNIISVYFVRELQIDVHGRPLTVNGKPQIVFDGKFRWSHGPLKITQVKGYRV